MFKKFKIVVLTIILSSLAFFSGCSCSGDENQNNVESAIATSIDSFKSAKLEMKLTNGETLLYSKIVDITKTDTGASHVTKIKELSSSLYDDSMYQESETNGTLTNEEIKSLFPSSEQFKNDKVTVVLNNENETQYLISKDNLMSVFDLEITEVNKISNEGVKVTFKYQDGKINDYLYSYKTIDNIDVIIRGTFNYN